METQELIKLYSEGNSLTSLSKYYNTTVSNIKKILQKHNIYIRNRKEQNVLTNQKRQKNLNHNYFSNIDSYNKAWLLGFLMADGTVRKNSNEIKIGLSFKDKEILEKIKKEINSDKQIKDYETSNGFQITEFRWNSKQHKEDLSKYGIVNKKTFLPTHLPKFSNNKLTLAFILGFYDGDGSISINKQGYVRMRFCAHRKELLEDIANFFQKEYGAKFSLSQDVRSLYELSTSTTYCIKILADMYNLNSICLDRKYQKFLEYINHETATSY